MFLLQVWIPPHALQDILMNAVEVAQEEAMLPLEPYAIAATINATETDIALAVQISRIPVPRTAAVVSIRTELTTAAEPV